MERDGLRAESSGPATDTVIGLGNVHSNSPTLSSVREGTRGGRHAADCVNNKPEMVKDLTRCIELVKAVLAKVRINRALFHRA